VIMDIENRQQSILKGYTMLLYFAGSMITYEPSEECIVDFLKNGIIKTLPVSSSNPNFVKAASQLRQSCDDSGLCGRSLKEDYIRLFSRPEMKLAPAIESFYNKSPHDLTSNQSESASEFYNSYGWVSKFRGKVQDDHLGVELLFLTRLIDKFLDMDDRVCRVEMRNEIVRFIDNHILSWVGQWNQKIQENSNTLTFRGIGSLILACAEDLRSLFTEDGKVSQKPFYC
jgi:putative dimethyl sulfoxide reductase chaperone